MVHWQLDLEVKILPTQCKWSSVHHMPLPALVAFPGILNIFPAKYFTKICQIFATYLPSLQTFATSVWRKSEVLWTIPIDVQTKKNNPVQKVLMWPVNLFTLNSLFIFKIVFTFLCERGWVVKEVVWRELKPRRMLRGVSPHWSITVSEYQSIRVLGRILMRARVSVYQGETRENLFPNIGVYPGLVVVWRRKRALSKATIDVHVTRTYLYLSVPTCTYVPVELYILQNTICTMCNLWTALYCCECKARWV